MYRLIYAIPMWILLFFIELILLSIGWIVVPIAASLKLYKKTSDNLEKPADGPIYHFTPKLLWLWDNEIDGIANTNYYKAKTLFGQIIYWSCKRNPVNNLRLVPFFGVKIDHKKIGYIGSLGSTAHPYSYDNSNKSELWFLCWHGPYTSYRRQYYNKKGKLIEFWIGHKLWPNDSTGPVQGYRSMGAGFTSQWREM